MEPLVELGGIILQESPLFVSPSENANSLMFFLLPQKALEVILLLHDAHNNTVYADRTNTPHHRLLDHLQGIMSTNSFGHWQAKKTSAATCPCSCYRVHCSTTRTNPMWRGIGMLKGIL